MRSEGLDELREFYTVLGVAPGASAHELKESYRDLAKVWHPDRFAHDPRLRQKAEEKLKEINEAYDRLTARDAFGRSHKPRAPSPHEANGHPSQGAERSARQSASRPSRRRRAGALMLVSGLMSAVVLFVLYSREPATRKAAEMTTAAEQSQPATAAQDSAPRNSGAVSSRSSSDTSEKRRARRQSATAIAEASGRVGGETQTRPPRSPTEGLRPLPTVTLIIDPYTGLIATADCPQKVRMTYPAGREPQRHCDAAHRRRDSR
jgi:curved DNA-binding protein CbpA